MRSKSGDLDANLWIDRTCVDALEPVTEELLAKWINIRVTRAFVDVRVPGVNDEIARFIEENPIWKESILDSEDPPRRSLAEAYHELGVRVLTEVERSVSHLVGWAYAERRHYWLKPPINLASMMMSRNTEYLATVRIDEGLPSRWCPPSRDRLTLIVESRETCIRQGDWESARRFVEGTNRPQLVGELLSNADALLAEAHYRSAIIEAVCALEIAVNDWARSPSLSAIHREILDVDASARGLKDQVKHLGFVGTLRYLVPIVVAQDCWDKQALEDALRAVEARNNIVHNGQRNVAESSARAGVRSARAMAQSLVGVTERAAASA